MRRFVTCDMRAKIPETVLLWCSATASTASSTGGGIQGNRARRGNQRRTFKQRENHTLRTEPHARGAPPSQPQHSKDTFDAAVVDVGQREMEMDVERHFSGAMDHLKTHAQDLPSDVPEHLRLTSIRDEANHFNYDGIVKAEHRNKRLGYDPGNGASFFDEGGLDVRSKRPVDHADMRAQSAASSDILNLSGGTSKRYKNEVDVNRSTESLSPSDPTAAEENEDAYKDTPVQITDMLKERLLELKGAKLSDHRTSTFLKRRLSLDATRALPPDEGLRKAIEASSSKSTRPSKNLNLTLEDEAVAKEHVPDDASVWGRASSTVGTYLEEQHDNLMGTSSSSKLNKRRHAASTHLVEELDAQDPFAFSLSTSKAAAAAAAAAPGAHLSGAEVHDAEDGDEFFDHHAAQRAAGVAAAGQVLLLRTLQRVGLCSRREAVSLTAAGDVTVDGVVERNPFRLVTAANDIKVKGHGQRLRFSPTRMWIYHKPANVVVSRHDRAGRALFVKHALLLGMDHLIPVGSLPLRAHGILLLTNDGELSRVLQHPSNLIQQTYNFRVKPAIDPILAEKLNTEGVRINGVVHRSAEFFVNHGARSRFHVKVKIRGESMPAHHILAHLGRHIQRGGRESFGPFTLHGLAPGGIREVSVPPFYAKHSGAVWGSFVERDWPYFRRLRVLKLRRLAKYRALSAKELEELDTFSFDEVREALQYESSELEAEARRFAQQLEQQPHADDTPLHVFGEPSHGDFTVDGERDSNSNGEGDDGFHLNPFEDDDAVVTDITKRA